MCVETIYTRTGRRLLCNVATVDGSGEAGRLRGRLRFDATAWEGCWRVYYIILVRVYEDWNNMQVSVDVF